MMSLSHDTIKHITYASTSPGPKLLVLGGVHGNETCGPIAIERVLAEFSGGAVSLERGQVIFVPVCNPEAARQDVRFIERNLNRFLVPTKNPQTYEAWLGNILCSLLESCDVLLDLHSYPLGDEAFVFLGRRDHPTEKAFAECLGPEKLVTGWESAYAAAGRKPPENPDEPTGTTEYARRFGAIAATIECGKHRAVTAPEIAYKAIRNALRHLGMVEFAEQIDADDRKQLITVQRVIYREQEGVFAQPWKNLMPITRGELIATYSNGTQFHATEDGYIIMPHFDAPIGAEWYYLGTET